jgi:hypothetical protein
MARLTAASKTPVTPAVQTPALALDIAIEASAPTKAGSSTLFTGLDEQAEYLRVVAYGREGAGKTTAALHAANLGKVLLINAEGGLKKAALRKQGVDTANISIFPPKAGVQITHRRLERVYQQVKADLIADPNSWYCVVFDSATDIVDSMVGFVADNRVTKSKERGVTIDEVDEFFTDRSDYGTMSKMFKDIIRKFRDLPCHLVITALERRDVDADTGKVMYGPAVTPGIQTALLGYVDLVLVYKAEDEDAPFRALAGKSGKYRTKDRFGVLPHVLADASFERILAYIDGDLVEQDDYLQTTLPVPKAKRPPKNTPDGETVEGQQDPTTDEDNESDD